MNAKSTNNDSDAKSLSRRNFIKSTTAASAVSLAGSAGFVHAKGSDKIRVGLIGCGGRGTKAAWQCVNAGSNIELFAMGELFKDRLDSSVKRIGKWAKKGTRDKINVGPRRFIGFDAYQKVLDSGVDLVILATPPHFRPLQLKAAIEAGKHVFMEKPVAVDPVGVRSVMESSKLAEKKGLAIVAGTQRRHTFGYIETMKRIHDGQIGELVGGQCYWNSGGLWHRGHNSSWSDMEYQLRNWLYFTWLSGDHICEQHVHNIDVLNWAFGGPPVKASGMGGRQSRTDSKYGNIFDHFAVEYEYANGARIMSMCRQCIGASRRVGERVVGSKGVAIPKGSISGNSDWNFHGRNVNGQEQEHIDLINSIRAGKPLNEGHRIAESTLTAILGRVSAYTGREVSFNWIMNASKLDLRPPKYEFCDLPVRPVAIPGKTKLV